MKVILTKDVVGLGRSGDIKEVSDGHARNFLIPRHLALPATSGTLIKVQKEQQEQQLKVVKDIERLIKIKSKLHNKTVVIKAKTNKKVLFAGLHEKEIAHAIGENLGVEISPDFIILTEPVKSIGLHEVKVRFAKDHEASVKLDVKAL